MAETQQFDVLVIGSGPGGYVGAIRAAQLGLRTACVEKSPTLGGTCLNVGCIPSKALLDSSEWFAQAKEKFAHHGVVCSNVTLDLPAMMQRKDKVVEGLTKGIEGLFKKNKVTRLQGQARFRDARTVTITAADGSTQDVQARAIVIATGSEPIALPTVPFDGERIVSSTEALTFSQVPQHLVVVGGGAIGLELGSVWLRLGAKVTVVELLPRLVPGIDAQIASALQRSLTKQGFSFMLGSKVTQATVNNGEVTLTVENDKKENKELKADRVLVAVGRKAYTAGLGAAEIGVAFDERGRVKVDHHYQTNVAGIYALGDAITGPMLAHKAEEEGVALAELLAGKAGHVNYDVVPGIVYTWPEVASVGLSEEAAKASEVQYKVGTFSFLANGRARCMDEADGMVKVIADAKTDRILGVHIVGPRASDIIAEAVMAMEFGASAEDMARAMHGHPTLPEALREAALNVEKRSRQS
ncbi:MAG: dihydrolipoyl dehydrogenase [Deltaproteobacteria bacterium]|nr:dihydrolipoyl dehydrogenase [Deltaproteobacteria bacterium]